MTFVVAYHIPHNEGLERGIIDGPGFDSDLNLVDLYEVDGRIKSFATRKEAEEWFKEIDAKNAKLNDWSNEDEETNE